MEYTAGCRYNTFQYMIMLHAALQWLRQNTNYGLNLDEGPWYNGNALY